MQPALQGYRLDAVSGEYVAWEADAEGRLWSDVLQLWLVARRARGILISEYRAARQSA